jgi:hypothetical protein
MSHTEPDHSRRGCPFCGEENGHNVQCKYFSGQPDAGAGNRAKTPKQKQTTGASRLAVKSHGKRKRTTSRR